MDEQKCVNCRFWNWRAHQAEGLGECRKEPPVILPPRIDDPDETYGTVFPRTDENDWCGAFQQQQF